MLAIIVGEGGQIKFDFGKTSPLTHLCNFRSRNISQGCYQSMATPEGFSHVMDTFYIGDNFSIASDSAYISYH